MALWLHVNAHSGIPIYVQLIEQIQHALSVGSLQAGEMLPTVRELASELMVAPNTIVKAYNELQRRGLIESRAGKGTVVAGKVHDALRQQQIDTLYERLQALVRDAANLDLDRDELRDHFEQATRQYFPAFQREGGPC